ncbi:MULTISPECIES: AAA family ATPase [unclassified Coleofasciculus]|uniref:AAA family ATPase n=1 Tax=unclassified Coleofasciculus TaxID=2692782 RepID=UPI001D13E7E9|nr:MULTISPECIES: AAA family ATPase [unclassified Coleofasciculus]
MLKRIYIDNFRCLVNFELDVNMINLFLGSNGTGKSTVFEVLQKIQAFVNGDNLSWAKLHSIETIMTKVPNIHLIGHGLCCLH